jgi:hypothetical protein
LPLTRQTYDSTLFSLLMSTLVLLLDSNPSITVLISATIRSEETFADFVSKCGSSNSSASLLLRRAELARLSTCDIRFSPCGEDEQTGPFYSLESPMRIIRIQPMKDGSGAE